MAWRAEYKPVMKMTSVFVALALLACSKGKDKDPDEQAKAQVVLERAREDVPKLMEKIANGTVTLSDCVAIVYLDDLAKADADLATKLKRLCTRDVQVSMVERQLAKADAERKAKPDATTLESCNDTYVMVAIDQLEEYGTIDAQARPLIERFDAACPTIAKVRAASRARKAARP